MNKNDNVPDGHKNETPEGRRHGLDGDPHRNDEIHETGLPSAAQAPASEGVASAVHDPAEGPEGASAAAIIDDGSVGRQKSLWSDAWVQLRKNSFFWVGGLLSLFYVSMALFPELYDRGIDPTDTDLIMSREGPSAGHWFGWDLQGADLYSNVIHGASSSMAIASVVTISIGVLGILLGAVSGYLGGWYDTIMSRVIEIFYAIPGILGAMMLLQTVFSGYRNVWTVGGALVIFGWMTAARLVRSNVLSVRESDYVAAAKVQGASAGRIISRHVLPNSIAPLIVLMTIQFGGMIAAEASLSFIGIGLQQPTISWGVQLNTGQRWFQDSPILVFAPGAVVSGAVLSFVLLGDALREALDPKGR